MALAASTFAAALDAIVPTEDGTAAHAAAFKTYMQLMTYPPVLPPVHDAAELAMRAALVGQESPVTGIAVMNAAYTTYMSVVAASLVASGFVTVPALPPGPILTPPAVGSGTAAYADTVHAWVGTYASSIPPTLPAFWV